MMNSRQSEHGRHTFSVAPGHSLSMSLIEDYDIFQLAVAHHDEMQERAVAEIGAAARAAPGDRYHVVEAGCGTGITTRGLLAANPKIDVTCVDIEPAMIDITRGTLETDVQRVKFELGDITNILTGLPDASFDAFASVFTLHHVREGNLARLFTEALRVLRPGGILINADKLARGDEGLHARDLNEQIEAFQEYDRVGRADLRREWTEHYLADDKTRIGELTHNALLEKAGFVDVHTIWRARMEAIVVAHKPL